MATVSPHLESDASDADDEVGTGTRTRRPSLSSFFFSSTTPSTIFTRTNSSSSSSSNDSTSTLNNDKLQYSHQPASSNSPAAPSVAYSGGEISTNSAIDIPADPDSSCCFNIATFSSIKTSSSSSSPARWIQEPSSSGVVANLLRQEQSPPSTTAISYSAPTDHKKINTILATSRVAAGLPMVSTTAAPLAHQFIDYRYAVGPANQEAAAGNGGLMGEKALALCTSSNSSYTGQNHYTSSSDPKAISGKILELSQAQSFASLASPYDQLPLQQQQVWQSNQQRQQQQYIPMRQYDASNWAGMSQESGSAGFHNQQQQPEDGNNSCFGESLDDRRFAGRTSSASTSHSIQESPRSPTFTFADGVSFPFQNADDAMSANHLSEHRRDNSHTGSASNMSRTGTGYIDTHNSFVGNSSRPPSSHSTASHGSHQSSSLLYLQQQQQYHSLSTVSGTETNQWGNAASYPQPYTTSTTTTRQPSMHPVPRSVLGHYMDGQGIHGDLHSYSGDTFPPTSTSHSHGVPSANPSAEAVNNSQSPTVNPSWNSPQSSGTLSAYGNTVTHQITHGDLAHVDPSSLTLPGGFANGFQQPGFSSSFTQHRQQHQLAHQSSTSSLGGRSSGSGAQSISLQSPGTLSSGVGDRPTIINDRRFSDSEAGQAYAFRQDGSDKSLISPTPVPPSAWQSHCFPYSEGWPLASANNDSNANHTYGSSFDFAFTNPPLHFDYSKPGDPQPMSNIVKPSYESNRTYHRRQHSSSSSAASRSRSRNSQYKDRSYTSGHDDFGSNASDQGASVSDNSAGSNYFSKGQKRSRPAGSSRRDMPAENRDRERMEIPKNDPTPMTSQQQPTFSAIRPDIRPVDTAYGASGLLLQSYYETLPQLSQMQLEGVTVMQTQPQPFYLKNTNTVPMALIEDTAPEPSESASESVSADSFGGDDSLDDMDDIREVSNSKNSKGTVTTSGRKSYQCKKCDRTFPRPSALIVHERIHSGEKPFVCEYCARPFTVASNLRRHQKIHAKEPMPKTAGENGKAEGDGMRSPEETQSSNGSTVKAPAASRIKSSHDSTTSSGVPGTLASIPNTPLSAQAEEVSLHRQSSSSHDANTVVNAGSSLTVQDGLHSRDFALSRPTSIEVTQTPHDSDRIKQWSKTVQ